MPSELNINSVGNVLDAAKELMSKEDKIIIDAKEVETIDALGMQLIFSIQKTAILNNIKLEIANAKPTLQKYLSYL